MYQNKYYICQNLSIMQIQLTNVSPEQLEALRKNFDPSIVISDSEQADKFDCSFLIETEIDAWKLFFSGADYCLAKMGRVKL